MCTRFQSSWVSLALPWALARQTRQQALRAERQERERMRAQVRLLEELTGCELSVLMQRDQVIRAKYR
jgi:hypothetical protein